MLFASSLSDCVFVTFALIALGGWGFRKILGQFDKEGQIHKSALDWVLEKIKVKK